jgi:glutamate/tyrosine decarboxylase-like PLP-dependent enzyme
MGQISLPQKGMSREEVLNTLKSFKSDDVKWHDGQLFGLIYEAGPEVEALVKEASALFLIENALNPNAFPSLVKMETEVVSNVISVSGGDDETVGNFTSGGTESIFMALKAARDWARHTNPRIKAPEMVVPVTAHPAWNKAAHYLDIKINMTPVKDDLRRITPEVPPADSQELSEQAAMYAMLVTMPDRSMAREFAVEYMNNLYRVL